MELKNKKILVTGAGGFIGSHLTEMLCEMECKNIKVLTQYNSLNRWDWLENINEEYKNKIEVHSGDIRDLYGIKKIMKNVDIVFHLAALIGIPFSYEYPDTYVDTNIKGTLNILQIANEYKIEKIVHTSTSEIYGTAQFVPITESHPINPQSPYAATKAAADFMCMSFYKSFNTPISIARPFNTFGPRQSARAVIPTIITQILNGNKIIKLGNIKATRDFTYVKDTCLGFIEIAKNDHCDGKIINIGSNFEISVKDLAFLIANITNTKITIEEIQDRKRPDSSEVNRLFSDNSMLKQLTNWKQKYTLEKGIEETINWFRSDNNISLYKSNIYNI